MGSFFNNVSFCQPIFTPSPPLSAFNQLSFHMSILMLDSGVVFATTRTSSLLQFCYSFDIRLVQEGAMLVKTVCFNNPIHMQRLKQAAAMAQLLTIRCLCTGFDRPGTGGGKKQYFFKADISFSLTPPPLSLFWSQLRVSWPKDPLLPLPPL